MPLTNPASKLRVNQAGAEFVGHWSGSGKLRVNQMGVEAIGAWSGDKLRVNQLALEILGGAASVDSNIRVNQLAMEILGFKIPIPSGSGRLRVNQLGLEAIGALSIPYPAGDVVGAEYYIGPGFGEGFVKEARPATYHPRQPLVEVLSFLGNLLGEEVTVYANTVSNVPLNGTTTIPVTFPVAFEQDCYYVSAEYVPAQGDSSPIYVKGICTQQTATGFVITGLIVVGSSTNTQGTFTYAAVGL